MRFCLLAFLTLFIFGCHYQHPVQDIAALPVDKQLLGHWTYSAPEDDEQTTEMRIIQFNDTEFLVAYSVDGTASLLRAYRLQIEGQSIYQVQIIHLEGEDISKLETPYLLAQITLDNDVLSVAFTDPEKLADGKDIGKRLLQAVQAGGLFDDPGRFKRASK